MLCVLKIEIFIELSAVVNPVLSLGEKKKFRRQRNAVVGKPGYGNVVLLVLGIASFPGDLELGIQQIENWSAEIEAATVADEGSVLDATGSLDVRFEFHCAEFTAQHAQGSGV